MWSRTFARGRRLADSRFFTSSNFLVSPAFSCFSFFPFCVDLYHYNNTPINVALWGTGATLLICPSQASGFLICFWPEWFFLQVLLSLLRCLGSMASFSGSLNTTIVSPNKVLNYHSEGEWFNSLYVFFVSSIFSRRSLVRSTLFVSQFLWRPRLCFAEVGLRHFVHHFDLLNPHPIMNEGSRFLLNIESLSPCSFPLWGEAGWVCG